MRDDSTATDCSLTCELAAPTESTPERHPLQFSGAPDKYTEPGTE